MDIFIPYQLKTEQFVRITLPSSPIRAVNLMEYLISKALSTSTNVSLPCLFNNQICQGKGIQNNVCPLLQGSQCTGMLKQGAAFLNGRINNDVINQANCGKSLPPCDLNF